VEDFLNIDMSRKRPIRSSLIFLGLTLLLMGITQYLIRPQMEKRKTQKEALQKLFPTLKSSSILKLSLFKKNQLVWTLTQEANSKESWFLSLPQEKGSPLEWSADKDAVQKLFQTLENTKKKEMEGLGKISDEVFSGEALRVEIESKNNNSMLQIGNDSAVGYYSYARKDSQDSHPILIERSLKNAFQKEPQTLREKSLFTEINSEALAQVELKNTQRKLVFEKLNENQWLLKDNPEIRIAPQSLEELFIQLKSEKALSFPEKMDFNEATASRISLREKEKNQNYSVFQNGTQSYLYNHETKITAEISEKLFSLVQKDLFHFRDKKTSRIVIDEVKRISLRLQKDQKKLSLNFQKDDDKWRSLNPLEKRKAKEAVLNKILEKLAVVTALEFYPKITASEAQISEENYVAFYDEENKEIGKIYLGKKSSENSSFVRTSREKDIHATALIFNDFINLDNTFYFQEIIQKTEKKAGKDPKNAVESQAKGKTINMLESTVTNKSELKKLPAAITAADKKYHAVIELSTGKKIQINFDAQKAPYTVSNFLHLARNKFYDGVSFHRVIPDFVAQGGDPEGSGRGGPGWMFDNEDNDLKHLTGSISMAHAGRDTNGSQFFLVLKPQAHLDGVHTVFGQLTEESIPALLELKQGDSMKSVQVFEENL